MKEAVAQAFEESARVKVAFVREHGDTLLRVAEHLVRVFRQGGKVLLFGNGGSATDASHIAGEMVNRFQVERPGLPAIALATDMAVLTSIGNDASFEDVFARQIEALGQPQDMAVAISTSGNSANVLRAVEAARRKGLVTVGLTGGDGGRLAAMVQWALVVPSTSVPRIQETHITIGHVLCDLVDRMLFPQAGGR